MTDAASMPRDAASTDRTNAALLGVVVSLAIINSLITGLWREDIPDFVGIVYFGFLLFQPIILGVWTALGAGSILTRLPIAALSLALLFVAPGTIPAEFARVQKFEFVATAIAGFAAFVLSTLLFLIFRRVTRFQLRSQQGEQSLGGSRLHFSTRYVLCMTTLIAVVLGFALNLEFRPEPPPQTMIFGRSFFITLIIVMGGILALAVLPTMGVPLAILYGHPSSRALKWLFAFWAIVSVAIGVMTIDQEPPPDNFLLLFAAQVTSSVAGATIAYALRYTGLRLVRAPKPSTNPDPLNH